jgi:hypothetical protein
LTVDPLRHDAAHGVLASLARRAWLSTSIRVIERFRVTVS